MEFTVPVVLPEDLMGVGFAPQQAEMIIATVLTLIQESALIPFTPIAPSASISATTSSSRVALPNSTATQVMVTAPATNADVALIRFGSSDITALTTSTPILPGTVQVFTVPGDGIVTHVAAICATSTASLIFTSGMGS